MAIKKKKDDEDLEIYSSFIFQVFIVRQSDEAVELNELDKLFQVFIVRQSDEAVELNELDKLFLFPFMNAVAIDQLKLGLKVLHCS